MSFDGPQQNLTKYEQTNAVPVDPAFEIQLDKVDNAPATTTSKAISV